MKQQYEAFDQECIFRWVKLNEHKYPELSLLYHIPNGGSRNKIEAANLKRQGVKAGVPDICLPVSRGVYHGLYIELKHGKNKLSDLQREWLGWLNEQGYMAVCIHGWDNAVDFIETYLKMVDEEIVDEEITE